MSEKRFDKIEEKMDEVKDEISKLNTIVATGFAVYNEQLKIHIKATEQNRDSIKLTNIEVDKVKNDILPLKENMKFLSKLGKLLVALGTGAGIILGILEYFK